jgi:hypothetical protein
MSRRPLVVRSLQVLAVGSAYGAWRLTQYLLEASRAPVTGFTDHSHALLAGANAWLNAHPALANVVLAMSSFEVDLAGISLVVFFFTRRQSRPLLTLWLILILRQICQATISVPAPEGMIWHYPGFPSLIVTYGTSTDFFFSGHMALATGVASEMTAQGAPRWKQAMAWGLVGLQALVILSMRFHYFTDVVTGCFAAVVASRLAEALSQRIDERFAPWAMRSADQYRYRPVTPAMPAVIGEEQA